MELKKQLQGRRKAGQLFVRFLAENLKTIGFKRSDSAPQFFFHPEKLVFIELHYDDGNMCGPEIGLTTVIDDMRMLELELTWSGVIAEGVEYSHLHRLRMQQGGRATIRANTKYADSCIKALGLEGAKPCVTPSVIGRKPEFDDDEQLDGDSTFLFRSCVGSLLYMAVDRKDVQYEVSLLSSFMSSPTKLAMVILRRVVRFLLGSRDFYVEWRKSPDADKQVWKIEIDGFSDSDWATCRSTRKSRTSIHIEVNGCALFSCSRAQDAIATSSGEAEFYAAASCISEMVGMRELFIFFGFEVSMRSLVDSAAAIGILR